MPTDSGPRGHSEDEGSNDEDGAGGGSSPAPVPVPIGFRFSIADGAMLIVAAASASALYARIYGSSKDWSALQHDAPILVVLAIVLTALALGSYKAHSAAQTCLQVALGCLGYLSLLWLVEFESYRPLLYWFQASFALTVAGPMLARRFVKTRMPRGPRRTSWKKTLEAVVFSFVNILLVATGMLLQYIIVEGMGSLWG